ncbi:MAG TPA: reverse transcriptase domain-containing protein [Anaerolineales bacterium]|nr:reverse transcriptase domain-containing protein [Anaerolineales bacterium]HLO29355.1 reverse transcriptase domain-containing protein [Anaerolineales bacterium]
MKASDLFTTSNPEQKLKQFLSLKVPSQLATLLDIKYERLVYHIYKVPADKKYSVFTIPKKSSGMRVISSPTTALKIIQEKLNEILLDVYKPKPAVYAYVRSRNIVLNARKHKRAKFILNLDLEDFFTSINFGRVRGLFLGKPYNLPNPVATVLAQICCHNNVLPQGAPTSPIISNMICAQMDSQLQALANENKCYYTRYADDITFSTFLREFPIEIANSRNLAEVDLGKKLKDIIESNGFKINPKKVRIQPRYRRQEVTGIIVNQFPNVRRNYIRQVRAMLHAWDAYGITNAENHYFTIFNKKHRNPELELPSFRQIIKGKIDYIGMVKGKDNEIYCKLLEKYRFLRARDEGIPRLNRTILNEINTPVVFVEGKTDVSILTVAWKKLFNNAPMQFKILKADTRPDTPGGGAGADTLSLMLNAHRPDDPYIAIGIFDRDREGKTKYLKQLHNDFIIDEANRWKIAKERRAGAMLLPIPEGKEGYDYYDSLCIEFYFSESALSQKTTDGNGLIWDYIKVEMQGKRLPEDKQIQIPEARMIKAGKVPFAELIVPTLEASEFESFRPLFEILITLINRIQDSN